MIGGGGGSRLDNISTILRELHLLPLTFRAQFTYKALDGVGPKYLKDRLLQHHLIRARLSAEASLCVPPVCEARLVGTRGRAPLAAFQHCVKMELFMQPLI